jgi:predicted RNA binding protein YcfA (HicA-like mRNA interferase family)
MQIFRSLTGDTMKVREVLARLSDEGWYQLKGKATSHRQSKHPEKLNKVTVPGKPGDELNPKTLASIYRQAGW